ncbi:hypothetical protein LCGC14_2298920 [marine sediment metagenome]|uniref:Restriction endonuclease type II-like domain-containing protein n=1 Tax=marine sediment metagenome TaxID=412755 RepID=A0A0F9DBK9_9ZZZZ
MKDALEEQKIPFEQEFPVRLGFVLDFALLKQRIAIECDGEKWHDNPKRIKKDRFRDYLLRRAGWKVIRFKGQKIMEDIDGCIREIKEVL